MKNSKTIRVLNKYVGSIICFSLTTLYYLKSLKGSSENGVGTPNLLGF